MLRYEPDSLFNQAAGLSGIWLNAVQQQKECSLLAALVVPGHSHIDWRCVFHADQKRGQHLQPLLSNSCYNHCRNAGSASCYYEALKLMDISASSFSY